MAYIIDESLCMGCAQCSVYCAFDAISPFGDNISHVYRIDPEKCMSCGQCADACPAGLISDEDPERRRILSVTIIREKCIGCSLCSRACPVRAVDGKIREPFFVDEDKCIKCGLCAKACRKDAVEVIYIA